MVTGLLRKCPQCLSLFCSYVPGYLSISILLKTFYLAPAINIMGGTREIQRLQGALIIWTENTSWHFSEI